MGGSFNWTDDSAALAPQVTEYRATRRERDGGRLAEPTGRDDVRGDVEGGLDGELEGVLDEAFLANVVIDQLEARDGPELVDAGLDERELLREEWFIRHPARR